MNRKPAPAPEGLQPAQGGAVIAQMAVPQR